MGLTSAGTGGKLTTMLNRIGLGKYQNSCKFRITNKLTRPIKDITTYTYLSTVGCLYKQLKISMSKKHRQQGRYTELTEQLLPASYVNVNCHTF